MSRRYPYRSQSLALTFAALLAGCEENPPVQATPARAELRSFEVRNQVDAARGRVWWLSRNGVFVHELNRTARAEVALPGWQVAGEGYACMPDLALGPRGDAFVTSNVSPIVWRIDARTLAVTEHRLALDADQDKDVGFTGLVYSPAHGAFYAASEAHGTLWRIDPALGGAQKIAVSALIRGACGLAVGSQAATRQAEKTSSLCVHAPQGEWLVDLAPDQRSAYVRAVACTARPD